MVFLMTFMSYLIIISKEEGEKFFIIKLFPPWKQKTTAPVCVCYARSDYVW